MRNDLQAAVEYFKSLLQTIADDEWNREARNSATAALSALRDALQRQPDPITGLVPCGCGGKAQMGKLLYTGNDPDLMPDLMTEYYAYCQDCGITTDNSTDMERVENEWNRAMGWREGNEN